MANYPSEIASIVRTQTFFIDSFLSPVTVDDKKDGGPLSLYSHWSRYRFYIISAERKRTYANINVQNAYSLINMSKFLYSQDCQKRYAPQKQSGDTASHPAYTVTIASGNHKGMTPAAVLLKYGDNGKNELRNQWKFLKEHLDRYPKNKYQMDAIVDAVNLYDAKQLNENEAESNASIEVKMYDAQLRPDIHHPREDGLCLISNCTISWHIGTKNPVDIKINQYYAPVIKKEDGTLNVQASKRDQSSVINNQMSLSVEEWMWCIKMIEMDMARFEMIYAKSSWKASQDLINAQRQQYNNSKNNGGSNKSYHASTNTYNATSETTQTHDTADAANVKPEPQAQPVPSYDDYTLDDVPFE